MHEGFKVEKIRSHDLHRDMRDIFDHSHSDIQKLRMSEMRSHSNCYQSHMQSQYLPMTTKACCQSSLHFCTLPHALVPTPWLRHTLSVGKVMEEVLRQCRYQHRSPGPGADRSRWLRSERPPFCAHAADVLRKLLEGSILLCNDQASGDLK